MELVLAVLAVLLLAVVLGVALLRGRGGRGAPPLPPPAPPVPPSTRPPEPAERVLEEVDSALLKEPQLEVPEPTAGRLTRLRDRLSRSQTTLGKGLFALLSRDALDDATWEEGGGRGHPPHLGHGPGRHQRARRPAPHARAG
jgi:fused signal recognition particle receptor